MIWRRGFLGAIAALLSAGICGLSACEAVAARCPTLTYHTAPTLKAQAACASLGVQTHGTDPGSYLFLTPGGNSGTGAGIFQDNGVLVWWLHTSAPDQEDMSVVHYQGQPYIAVWTGSPRSHGSWGVGTVTLYDTHYQVAGHIVISREYGANGIDLHEFQITPEGDALVGSYKPQRMRVHGHLVTVLGYLVEKWSLVRDSSGIHTGKVLFAWNSLSDVRLSDSHYPAPGSGGVWDYFHGNGITEAPNGDLLVSGRNTWGIYDVSTHRRSRGFDHVFWQVGGPHDSRLSEPWCYQHDISALGHGVYGVYDDGGTGPGCAVHTTQHPARGLIFSVSVTRRPVRIRLIRAYTHKPPIYSGYTGSMQVLDNGDALIDWANTPEVTEYDSSGRDVKMDLSLSNWSYRGLRFAWDGQPTQPPAIASQRTASSTNVWASWNGSTEVTAWRVLGGSDPQHLSPVGGPFTKAGFETEMSVTGHYARLAVQALSPSGAVLSTSNAISG